MIRYQHFHRDRPEGNQVTVIIPVLNESETIKSVVAFARRSSLVDEVIVVDDGSIDGTPEFAAEAGARVITSTMLGKGASMEDGLREAKNDILLYLDGDLQGLCDDLVEKMTAPIRSEEADFVKAKFQRAAGRVTVLTARPLLKTYFPELSHLDQPLSGIMAARRSLLETLRFENDYGVDVGLLIDASSAKARIAEVDIGHLEHDSHPLDVLEEMATQVARAILVRAAAWGRLRNTYFEHVLENERLSKAHPFSLMDRMPAPGRLALFDMDGVLLNGRFIVELTRRAQKEEELSRFLDNPKFTAEERTRQIGQILTGLPRELFATTAREMPLMPGAIETVVGLRKAGFRVGIVTDSFQIVAETVRRRVFADFCFANLMRFKRGKASGKITLCPAMFHDEGCATHAFCKSNILLHLREKLNLGPEQILAVGDGENDICNLRAAGLSVAFQPKSAAVAEAANYVLNENLTDILGLIHALPAKDSISMA